MNTTQRGFIPLAIVAILGIATIAGGTAVVISNKESKQEISVMVAPQEQPEDILEEVEKGSTLETTVEQTTHLEANLDDVSTPTRQVKIDVEIKTICEDVDLEITEKKQGGEYTEHSLLGQIEELCGELEVGLLTLDELKRQDAIERNIQEKRNLLLITYENTKHEEKDPRDPRLLLIDSFLADQTPDSFKDFCTKAKEYEGRGTVQEFNESRTGYVERKETLAESIRSCMLILGDTEDSKDYRWATYNSKYLLLMNDDSESDEIRRKKIDYNRRLEKVEPNKVFGYNTAFSRTESLDLQDWIDDFIDGSSGEPILLRTLIVIPEEEISHIRDRIWTD